MRYDASDARISKAPCPIDWMFRYEPVLDFITSTNDCADILDFGSGNVGLGSLFTGAYYGADVTPIQPQVENLIPITDSHPFDITKQFDLVCAMDVLEHIPVPERWTFFLTLKRVARKWIILSYPTNRGGRLFDIETLALFSGGSSRSIPPWLAEHLSWPHPDPDEVMAQIATAGLKVIRRMNHTNRLWHYLGCIGFSVEGPWKIKILNDIHIVNQALSATNDLATYREVVILEV